jgi:hypothetical protein
VVANPYKRKATTALPTMMTAPPCTPVNPYKKRATIAVPPITPANPYKKRAAPNLSLETPENPYKKRSVPAAAINEAAQSLLAFHDSETPLRPTHSSVITPSPVATSAHSFTFRKPCLRQMLLDFRTSMSDNRGRGSHMPANVITTIADTIPVPRTVHELSLVKHVGKALMNKHGSSILKICVQFTKESTIQRIRQQTSYSNWNHLLFPQWSPSLHQLTWNFCDPPSRRTSQGFISFSL